jgi:hypothetical protein
MKKLILSILLFTVINCSGQYKCVYQDTAAMLKPYKKDLVGSKYIFQDTLGVRTIIEGKTLDGFDIWRTPKNVFPFTINEYKPSFHIDSTYLQLIIQELERHGYTLSKLPVKKNVKIQESWCFINAPSVSKMSDGQIIVEGNDYEKAIKDLFNECERLNKLYYECKNDRYIKH